MRYRALNNEAIPSQSDVEPYTIYTFCLGSTVKIEDHSKTVQVNKNKTPFLEQAAWMSPEA